MMNASKVLKNKGFTLVESLIALLIIGIALTSLMGSYSQNTRYLSYAKEKSLSQILVDNLIVEQRLGPKLSLGRRSDSIKFGRTTWYWQTLVSEFQTDGILQVQLKLFASKADRDNKTPIQSQKFYVRQ